MTASISRSAGRTDPCTVATAEVGDKELFAHFLRVQSAFLSRVRCQDIDLAVRHRPRAR
jgi:hypothetical protein